MPRVSDRWVSIALSVLLHAALLGALVYGWLLFRRPPRPTPTLAIEARVVDARSVTGAAQPAPPSPPPESEGPPQPTPEELAQREQQRQQEEAAAQQQLAEQQAAEAAAAEAARREAEQRAAAERKEREAAEAQKRAAEEQQRATEAKEQSEREQELQRDLAAEEQGRRARAGPALAAWQSQIAARINRAWLRPPTARAGIECMLNVTQVPGGEVTEVSIGECNGDQAVRESIEAAVYRASPLPPPPDPDLFDRHLRIDFKPD
ncbi:MAG: cell envelope integrity protein TolA [Gammaproteobacteria bacterium]|nr:cell envelope integrity protein TolA [Gammaproteobacteria bacterium]MBV8306130.1 cell envelope integrity protein TolA [Gammaproteobacteria bacterium]